MQKQSISMSIIPLHSTMFLLIQEAAPARKRQYSCFTFHNVSINTKKHDNYYVAGPVFTFHNVSINTYRWEYDDSDNLIFTFHNVSINTHTSTEAVRLMWSFTFHNVSINTEKM